MRASFIVGLIWLATRYIFVAALPHLDLQSLYGPFYISVGLLFWAYISGLILFAGAQYSVARLGNHKSRKPATDEVIDQHDRVHHLRETDRSS